MILEKNKPIKMTKLNLVMEEEQTKKVEEYFSGILNKGKDKKTQSTEEETEENKK
jgi:hypothetical protein